MQKVLFIDRDGVLMKEPSDYQIDHISKITFLPGMLKYMSEIAGKLDYLLVMVSNQDGLGTTNYPESVFRDVQGLLLRTLEGEGIVFDEILIDRSFPEENSPDRKPGTGMLHKYLSGSYDLKNSFVIGDRITDMLLAKNLGTGAILLNSFENEHPDITVDLKAAGWKEVFNFLFTLERKSRTQRITTETSIDGAINLDGVGNSQISTGLGFLDHMLEQIARHAGLDIYLNTKGDLKVDEHHTIEDTAIVFGKLIHQALAKRAGIERYGYFLPMDDSKAEVLLDFGGRSWLNWNVDFKREKIGEMPTEMFYHFFKSFCDHALCNLSITADGDNEHHKIESVFKAFAKAIKMAKTRNFIDTQIPSTKGSL
ncbi:MAG: bifunctional histidinol-phosphatase/imidazoleglycerol-phosphate dehydratase HisB [Saprospiraceae bacterium]|nr:bifunctional histidinol-phosphatase/imidazoleglycerol-phosphate dehydratase HisB [Saprospiraceae bacterium]